MRSLSPFLGVLLHLLLLSSSAAVDLRPRPPRPRTYDTHSYYTLELSPTSPPSLVESISQALGVELVEPLGELAGHWLVRAGGGTPDHRSARRSIASDPILTRWSSLQANTPRSITRSHLRSLTPLVLRQRSKRGSSHHTPLPRNPSGHSLYERDDETELLFAQGDLGIADPMLSQQWHLINTQMQDIELNVTDLWSRGVTGDGVKVVIVDDGLDANSDDLKDNFVSKQADLYRAC